VIKRPLPTQAKAAECFLQKNRPYPASRTLGGASPSQEVPLSQAVTVGKTRERKSKKGVAQTNRGKFLIRQGVYCVGHLSP